MNSIIDSTNEQLMISIDEALRRCGVDSFVQNVGVNSSNKPTYAVIAPLSTDAVWARKLLYSDSKFLNDMNPELANYIIGIRGENLIELGGLLQSKIMYRLSMAALLAILIGYFSGL